ncbi:MAG TPA: ABC transporter permease subunit [Anaeromyxobacteraceae bacterium]|nr:ABC transporter permease subunit [Anaeromyxobacteraceae bacterium]
MSGTRAAVPPRPFLLRLPGLGLLLALALAWRLSEGDLAALFAPAARASFADFARGFWPPASSRDFLLSLGRPLAETVAIAACGMALALALGAPLALLATSPQVSAALGGRAGKGRRALQLAARGLLALLRSIPEVIWALLFVRAVGIGPAPGVLAVGLAYAGVIGKVFAEILDATPRQAAAALAEAGASPARAFLFGLFPPARPVLLSYALYRFDCALRTSAVLGIVGAGGLGQQIELSLKLLRPDEVATEVLLLLVLVGGVDLASVWLRGRLERRRSLLPEGAAGLLRTAAEALAVAAAVALSAWLLDLSPAALAGAEARAGALQFLRGLWPPDLGLAALRAEVLPACVETLALSVLGTALGAAGGLALALAAAHRLRAAGGERDAWPGRALALLLAGLARAGLAFARTLPELLWALFFVLAVGLGPFAGALALGVHTGGVLGRLYAEVLEEVPPGPVRALRQAGATPFAAAVLGALPQAWPQLLAYTLYRWEVNIRASAVLGVVGAGGLGRALHVSMGLFDDHRTATLVLAVLALVTLVDLASGLLRERLGASFTSRASTHP